MDSYPLTGHKSIDNKEDIYPAAFGPEKKKLFLRAYKASGLRLYATCNKLSISRHTIIDACQKDPDFREAFRQCTNDVVEEIEAKSREMALTDKGFMDRIAQLRALLPEKYARSEISGNSIPAITINIDSDTLSKISRRQEMVKKAIDAEIVGQGQLSESV